MQYRTLQTPHMQFTKLNSVLLCPNLHADAPIQLDPARQSAGNTAGAENEAKRMLKADTHILVLGILQIHYT